MNSIMLQRPLLALDSNSIAEHAIPFVTLLARQLHQPVVLVSVTPDEHDVDHVVRMARSGIAVVGHQFAQRADMYLRRMRARLSEEGVEAVIDVRRGEAAPAILEAARAHDAELIAVATHGRGGLERWVLGSVADKVVRNSPVPVLLVKPPEGDRPAVAALTELLVPLDGSQVAEAAIPYAAYLARAFSVPIRVIRTVPVSPWTAASTDVDGATIVPPEVLAELEEDAQHYLERIVAQLVEQEVQATAHFATLKAPEAEILERAAAVAGSFVVMTSNGRTGWRRTLLGSVTDRVVRGCSVPVLVIRPPSD
jgi:nucleotide-binding universal stress UspA family protein